MPDDDQTVVLEVGEDLRVTVTDALCSNLEELLGEHAVRLTPKPDRARSSRGRAWGNNWNRGNAHPGRPNGF